jgi:hypothetical protein
MKYNFKCEVAVTKWREFNEILEDFTFPAGTHSVLVAEIALR